MVHCFPFIKYPSTHSEHAAPEYPVLQLQFCHPLHNSIPIVLHPQPKLLTQKSIIKVLSLEGKLSLRRGSSLWDGSTFTIFLFCDVSRKTFYLIFKQFVYLIKHYAIQIYSRLNMSNHILCEEKTKQTLISSQDIMVLLYLLISSPRDLLSSTFKHNCIYY